jgi:hypothetical protein
MSTRFASLLFGTQQAKEVVRAALTELSPGLTWSERDSDYRGGLYYVSPAGPGGDPAAERMYVQDNTDGRDVAEGEWPDVPTLLYVDTLAPTDQRVAELIGVAGLRLLRQDRVPGRR